MKTLELYDPPMCCSSGVCGPSVDPVLAQLAADLEWLKSQGIAVTRHNLSQQPADFAANPVVRGYLQQHGQEALPLLFADGGVIAARFYPNRNQFAKIFGLKVANCGEETKGCCG